MPDISMCPDDTCPSREQCYRFMATPSEPYQTFTVFDREGEDRCDAFMEIWNNETRS